MEPMLSLMGEEGFEPVAIMADDDVWTEEATAVTAAHILRHAPMTWENYLVAPPGNRPIHSELNPTESKSENGA